MSSLREDPSCLKAGSFSCATNAWVSGVRWLALPTTTSPGALRSTAAACRRWGAWPGRCTCAPWPLAAQYTVPCGESGSSTPKSEEAGVGVQHKVRSLALGWPVNSAVCRAGWAEGRGHGRAQQQIHHNQTPTPGPPPPQDRQPPPKRPNHPKGGSLHPLALPPRPALGGCPPGARC